jgi:hypothetical protein
MPALHLAQGQDAPENEPAASIELILGLHAHMPVAKPASTPSELYLPESFTEESRVSAEQPPERSLRNQCSQAYGREE